MKRSPLVLLKKDCKGKLEGQKRQAVLSKRRRAYLLDLIHQEYWALHCALKKFPLLASPADKKNYGEFKRSYDLFCVQIENTLSALKNPVQIELIPFPENQEINLWEDYRDDLLDAQKGNARIIAQYEKEGFLTILQILDTVERLQGFSFPNKGPRGKDYQKALEKLQKQTNETRQTILNALNRRNIKEIPLNPGIYPPIETTRIISRNDKQTNDEIIISRVNEKGYTWKTSLLRKAAVEVITKA
jgi:hypothetical protein